MSVNRIHLISIFLIFILEINNIQGEKRESTYMWIFSVKKLKLTYFSMFFFKKNLIIICAFYSLNKKLSKIREKIY